MDFTTDFTKAQDFISRVTATGGGDAAEDITGALEYVLSKASFNRKATLVTILITDAPTHGLQYHDANFNDDHKVVPEGSLESAIQRLAKKSRVFYFCCFRLNLTTDKMYWMMKQAHPDL